MDFIVEPTESYTLQQISDKLTLMNVPHIFIKVLNSDAIKADLTFDEVCDLKDMAYCTHEAHHES